MWENLFDHINIKPENVHIPNGAVPRESLQQETESYEAAIRAAGGIDLQILGIGKTGHIGFNEPGSGIDSRTRPIALDTITRRDAAADFFGEDNVPTEAITMGVATIMEAREVALIATGEHKAAISSTIRTRCSMWTPLQLRTSPASVLRGLSVKSNGTTTSRWRPSSG
jgi:glucosamine-6-phosphate deaminase